MLFIYHSEGDKIEPNLDTSKSLIIMLVMQNNIPAYPFKLLTL